MLPTVFRIPYFERDVPGFGLMLMIGFLMAVGWAVRRTIRSGGNPDVILNCGFVALIAGVVGCRAMHVVHYWDQFANLGNWLTIAWAILDVSKGGLEYYGGFLLSVISVPLWLRLVEKVSLRWYMDIIAPSAAVGLAVGRLGCFVNGCCYGSTCDLPWAVTFPYGSPASVEQWKHCVPGAELPKELLRSRGPIFQPISRESIAATDRELEAAEKCMPVLRELTDKLNATKDANERKNVEKAIRDQIAAGRLAGSRFGCACAPDVTQYGELVNTAQKYALTPAQVKQIAAQHPALPVHPTQIYSTITAGLIALLLNAIYWRRTRDGQVIFCLLMIEPISRYVLEIIRADNPVDSLGTFTISQAIAGGVTLLGLAGLFMLRWLPPRSPIARVWTPEPEPAANPKAARGAKR